MKQHFVNFLSPGTFVSEQTTKPIDNWDVNTAQDIARGIVERYGATPYGFFFTTRERGPHDLDSRESARSATYYLGGVVETAEQIMARNDPKEEILRFNIRSNGYDRIITNTNSWRFTAGLKPADVVLDWKP